jgi:hypothetical protein
MGLDIFEGQQPVSGMGGEKRRPARLIPRFQVWSAGCAVMSFTNSSGMEVGEQLIMESNSGAALSPQKYTKVLMFSTVNATFFGKRVFVDVTEEK